jgi:PAS domain S-box-containing protein
MPGVEVNMMMGFLWARLPLPLFRTAPQNASARSPFWIIGYLIPFLFLLAGIVTSRYCYFRHQVTASHKEAENELSAVGNMKVQQILDWRKERLGNAEQIMVEPFAGHYVEEFLTTGVLAVVLIVVAALSVVLLGRRHDSQVLGHQLTIEREHRLILDSTDEGILGMDSQGRHVFVNPAACRMLGFTAEELIGKPGHATWHYQKADGTAYSPQECPIFATLRTGKPYHSDQEVFWRKDGTSFPAEYIATPSLESDKSVATVLLFHDVSERKRVEEELRRSEQRYRVLLESSCDAIMTLAPPAWKFTSGNPACIEMFRTKDEAAFVSLGPWELSPDCQPDGLASSDKAGEMIETAMRKGSHFFEWTHQRLAGEAFPTTVLLTRVELDGKPALLATVRDITREKRAEEDQTLAVQRMESLLTLNRMGDQPLDAIVTKVVEDAIRVTQSEIGYLAILNEDESSLTMQYWSKSAHESCKMVDKPIVYPVEKTGLWGEAVRQRRPIITNDYAAPNPLKRGTPEGHVPIGRHMNVPVFSGDRIVAIAGVGNKRAKYDDRDGRQLQLLMEGWQHIVTCKQADEELRRYAEALESTNRALEQSNRRAEAASHSKGQFLANMSHEIRTPMTAILGFTDILLADLKESQSIEAAQTVKRNGEHLLRLINDILDISKIEAGRMEMEKMQWSPRQVVAEVVSLMHVRADAKGLTLSEEYEGPLPETITTDPARLRQILVNLVGNAIKFTDTGSVRIVTRLLRGTGEEPKLSFDVIDTGIGISEATIGGLFQPFTQVDASASRKYEGTGLGLSISRQLARMLGGDVTAHSELGQGSTFTATVTTGPLEGVSLVEYFQEARPAAEQPDASLALARQKLHCRILLAEDIPDNQRVVVSILRRAGAEVDIANDGREVVKKAMATHPGRGRRSVDPIEPFDVILMDMQMPSLDGYAATRRLRQEGYARPIIALTAHAMTHDRQKCLDAGCDDFLSKPVDQRRLVQTVAKWVTSSRKDAPSAVGLKVPSEKAGQVT